MAAENEAYISAETIAFYQRAMHTLRDAGIPFLVGGAYAMTHHGGIVRHTKDLDIFVRKEHADQAMELLGKTGCRTEVTFPHWLAKAHCGDDFIDLIYSSGNGLAVVDDEWFDNAREGDVFGVRVLLCPPEEVLWSKASIMERERYDGADVAHILRRIGDKLDWERLIRRFGPDWRVLLSHVVLFGFIYPGEKHKIPDWVVRELLGRLEQEVGQPVEPGRVCQGTLLSRAQYLVDIRQWGYRDARVSTRKTMSDADAAQWTAAIDADAAAREAAPRGGQDDDEAGSESAST